MRAGFLKKCSNAPLYYQLEGTAVRVFKVHFHEEGQRDSQLRSQRTRLEQLALVDIGPLKLPAATYMGVHITDSIQPMVVACYKSNEHRPMLSMRFFELFGMKRADVCSPKNTFVAIEAVAYEPAIGLVFYGQGRLYLFSVLEEARTTSDDLRVTSQSEPGTVKYLEYISQRLQVHRIRLVKQGTLTFLAGLQCTQDGKPVLVSVRCDGSTILSVYTDNEALNQSLSKGEDSQEDLAMRRHVQQEEIIYRSGALSQVREAIIDASRFYLLDSITDYDCETPVDLRREWSTNQQFTYVVTETSKGLYLELLALSKKDKVRMDQALLLEPHGQEMGQAIIQNHQLFGEERYKYIHLLRKLADRRQLPDMSLSSVFKFFLKWRPQVLPDLILPTNSLRSILKFNSLCEQWCINLRAELFDNRQARHLLEDDFFGHVVELDKKTTLTLRCLQFILEMQHRILIVAVDEQRDYCQSKGIQTIEPAYKQTISWLTRTMNITRMTAIAVRLLPDFTQYWINLREQFSQIRQHRYNSSGCELPSIPNFLLLEWFQPTFPIGLQVLPETMFQHLKSCGQFQLNYFQHRLQEQCSCRNKNSCEITKHIIDGETKERRGDGSTYDICNTLCELIDNQTDDLPEEALLYLGCWAYHQKNFTASMKFLRQRQVDWLANLELVCEIYLNCRQLKRLCCEFSIRFLESSLDRSLQRQTVEHVESIVEKYHPCWKQLVKYYWRLPS